MKQSLGHEPDRVEAATNSEVVWLFRGIGRYTSSCRSRLNKFKYTTTCKFLKIIRYVGTGNSSTAYIYESIPNYFDPSCVTKNTTGSRVIIKRIV